MRKELTPFCGILKTGGLAQRRPSIDEFAVPDEDDVPFFSSQGSTISDVSVTSNGNGHRNKRRFDGEEEVQEDDVMVSRAALDFWHEEEISPRSMMPVDSFRSSSLTERALAVPKSRRKIVNSGMAKMVGVVDGQENVLDFGEADFLDYEGLREVDMIDG